MSMRSHWSHLLPLHQPYSREGAMEWLDHFPSDLMQSLLGYLSMVHLGMFTGSKPEAQRLLQKLGAGDVTQSELHDSNMNTSVAFSLHDTIDTEVQMV